MGMLGVKPDARPQTMAAVRQALKERSQPAPAHRACPTCGGLLRRDTVCRRCAPEPVRLAPRPAPAEAEKAAALDFSPQRAELAFAHGDDLCWWDVSTGQPAGKVTVPGGVRDLAWSPDGRSMATAGRTLLLWYERERLRALEGHEGAVLAVAFSPTDWLLASGSVDQHVVLWDWNSGQLLCRLPGHTQPVWGVAFSPDGRLFASASQDHSIRLWSAPEGRLVRVLEGHADWVWDLAFAPDGHTLASASFDRTVRLWPIDRKWTRFFGESSPRVVTFRTPLMSVRFCPVDSHRLAVGGWDGVVHLWDRRQEKELARLEGHEAAVGRMAWSPDGRLLAAAGLGSSVRLWDPANGHLMSVVR
jgi:WD40 repeat protein